MITAIYSFMDYTPLAISLNSLEDMNNLNILLHYVMSGAKVYHDSSANENEQNYFVDMSFEEKPIPVMPNKYALGVGSNE